MDAAAASVVVLVTVTPAFTVAAPNFTVAVVGDVGFTVVVVARR